ncbi:AAA family ATPase [Corynebacterium breve]|uniref:AAA family ATPase n=1 Tax=Corynebacterium breve TaxID=3049799 RepID=A0ABY8VFN8_9CORY|nr:AAA family ATPase [Corynebacterium breve]WIM67585.1 AAA family ATPase [Corynebacterium breve]
MRAITQYRLRTRPLASHKIPSWVHDVPAVQVLKRIGTFEFNSPITIFTGDAGVGKSTLLEGIARSYGFNLIGGPLGFDRAGPFDPLYGLATVTLGLHAKEGYFLRGESHFAMATRYGNSAPNATNLHHMSHGESVMHIAQTFHANGLYLLDEPESGLSAIRQMALLALLADITRDGAQVIMVTHSPILLALPNAHIIELDDDATFSTPTLETTTAYRALRDFLADPETIAQFMVDVTDPGRT